MKLEKTCQSCIWYDSCDGEQTCDDFAPNNDKYIETAYKVDLRLRAREYWSYVNEMGGDA